MAEETAGLMFEMPHGAARDYLHVFGVASIYVAVSAGDAYCRIGSSLDIRMTQTFIKRRFKIAKVFWVRDSKTAQRVVRAARSHLPVQDGVVRLSGDVVEREIEAVARQLGVVLTEHSAAMARVTKALGHVDGVLALAHSEGRLSWFNRAYKGYRRDSTGRTMLFGEAKVRLRNAVVRRIMAGQGLENLEREVFGEVYTTIDRPSPKTSLTS